YFIESLRLFPGARLRGIDISEGSLATAKGMINAFAPDTAYDLRLADVFQFNEGSYDYIVMGEVLEHVDDPLALLGRINGLLNPGGRFFVTTCANAPAEDHVYLYDSLGHIQKHLTQTGFHIDAEIAFAVDDKPEAEWETGRTEINYAAFLTKE
ncbi:MAG: class I SAM-dependent methyltransferase, partial [Candidatus Omnitrophica bacterium]|nr:class I SAM-dependent methyltransferase [Candidatus Omnitrophota bacterium]